MGARRIRQQGIYVAPALARAAAGTIGAGLLAALAQLRDEARMRSPSSNGLRPCACAYVPARLSVRWGGPVALAGIHI